MTTQFPTGLDTYTAHTNGEVVDASHINNVQDALAAVQARVGVSSSTTATSHDYLITRGAEDREWLRTSGSAPTGTIWQNVYSDVTFNTPAVVTLRLDDGRTTDPTIYNLLLARKLVAGMPVNRGLMGGTGYVALSVIQGWQQNGMEIMSHSRMHGDPTTVNGTNLSATADQQYASFYDEAITCTDELRNTDGLICDSFVQPGTWTANYYINSEPLSDTRQARALSSKFASWQAYRRAQNWNNIQPMPTRYRAGIWVYDMTASTQSAIQGVIDAAVSYGGWANLLVHTALLDTAGQLTTTALTAVLDYIQTKVNAGLVTNLTPTGAAYAQYAATPRNLCRDPQFLLSSTGTYPAWIPIGSPPVTTNSGSGGTGTNALQLTNTAYIEFDLKAELIRTMRVKVDARNTTAGVTGTLQNIWRAVDVNGTQLSTMTLNSTTTDAYATYEFTVGNTSPAATRLRLYFLTSGTAGVTISNVRVYKL